MTTPDYIQIAILIVMFGTMLVFLRMVILQNRLLKSQIIRDRFESYWKTYGSVSESEMREAHLLPENYMNTEKYEQFYKHNEEALYRYIQVSHLYEFLAFSHLLKDKKLVDPLGEIWTVRWLKTLIGYKEFEDVHSYFKCSYPEFAKYVDELRLRNNHNKK